MMMRSIYALALLATTALAAPAFCDPLDDGFRNPPQSARPRVWWHWMNGNVTEEGIKLDLEWMKRIGIGGVQNFDAELQTPQVVEKRLVYMTPEWKHAFRFAAETADRLGLEMAIAASPGWSESGGPWVKPEDGMKKLVWSEVLVAGGHSFKGVLPLPPSTTGPFQNMALPTDILSTSHSGKAPLPSLYRDTRVIAYRITGAPVATPIFSSPGTIANYALLSDGRYDAAVELSAGSKGSPTILRADFAQPQRISSASLALPPAWLFGDGPFAPVLEASSDGRNFSEIATFPNKSSPQYTVTFPTVTAKAMRIVFRPAEGGFGLPSPPAAGVDFSALGGFGGGAAKTIAVNEVSFSAAPHVHRFEEKAGFAMNADYFGIASADGPGLAASDVIDLTAKMRANGTLDWTPPNGDWRVLRFGYSLTGKENHPATREATGLEVDKFDADAVRRYINTYLDTYVDAAGRDLIGRRGVDAVLNDSIEVGAANWTATLPAEFKARRGYDLAPWMPALTGVVIGSSAKTDAFLYDFRKTLGELISEAHYATIATEVHKRGLIHYSEALESGRPSIGDDMAMRRHADVPMAAMWSYPADAIGPQPQYWGDIRGAASVAHVYGQNIVAAESLTSALQYWAYSPRDLQPMIDMEFALGVNRPVIHTSVHQPLTDHAPGFSLWIFGQTFSRLETWGGMARPWIDYIARNSFMLQQGRNVADVAYFYGEEAPLTAQYAGGVPKDLPSANGFDYVNADAILNELSNDGRDVVAKSGARYKVIYLGGSSAHMTLPVLKRLNALVRGGATLVGEKPIGSPSLSDDPAAFARVADALWRSSKVLASRDIDAALKTLGVVPDYEYTKPESDTNLMFVHRVIDRAANSPTHIYYFTNRKNRAEAVTVSLPVLQQPTLWDAETGRSTPVDYNVKDGRLTVPLALRPFQSGFLVLSGEKPLLPRFAAPVRASTQLLPIADQWTLSFQPGRGGPSAAVSGMLGDWSKNADPAIRYFSGTGTYTRAIDIPASAIGKGKALYLDLGEVHDVAEVLVNGQSAGIAWKPPYRVDISGVAKAGANALEIRVANLWVNRLIGDAQPGAKPITFTTVKTYTKDAPLRPSGLIGPVQLEIER